MVRCFDLVFKTLRLRTETFASYVTLLMLTVLLLSSSRVHAQTDFKCIPVFYQVLSGQLNEYDPVSGNYSPLGPDHNNYNAMGYNPVDGYVYGMHGGNVVRVDATGTLVNLGPPTATDGTTSISSNYAGDIDSAGFLWTNRGGNSNVLNKIDVVNLTYETVTFTGPTIRSADFTLIPAPNGDEVFYGTRNQTLYIANATTLVSSTKTVAGLPNGTYGAAFTDSSGRLYVSNNHGGLYLVADYDKENPYAVFLAATERSNANDGAACRDADSPFEASIDVSKSLAEVPQWNGTNYDVSFDIVVTNTNTIGLGGLDLIDDVVTQLGSTLVSINSDPVITNTGNTSTLPTINTDWKSDTTLSILNDDGTLLAGQSFTVTVTVQIDPTAAIPPSLYNNSVVVSADDPLAPDAPGSPPDNGANSVVSAEDDTSFQIPDIQVEKSDTSVVPAASGVAGNFDISYFFTVSNPGTERLTVLSLVDDWADQFGSAFVRVIPSSVSVNNINASTVPSANPAYTGAASESMISGGTLNIGESFSVRVVVEVDPDADAAVLASGQLVNQATVGGNYGKGESVSDLSDDPDEAANVDSEDDGDADDPTVVPLDFLEYDLALIKEQTAISATPPTHGTQVTYKITVMNQGDVISGSYTVDELIPAGMTFVSASPAATSDPGVGNTGTVQWVVPASSQLAVQETTSFEVVLEVADVRLSPFHNIAEIAADNGDDYGGDDDSKPGNGSGAADTFNDNDVSNDNDPGDEDDSDFEDLEVEADYDLALIKEQVSQSTTPANLDTEITYEITVMNQGNVATGSFTVDEQIPPGMTFVSASPSASSDPGVGNSGLVQWIVPLADELAPSEQQIFQVVLKVSDVTLSPYHNIAEITADNGAPYGGDDDSKPGNGSGASDTFNDSDVSNDNDPGDEDDSDFEDLKVEAEYDLALIKEQASLSATPATIGTQVTYEITVMNQGNVPTGAFAVEDTMPAGLTFMSASPAASADPGVGATGPVRWTVTAADELAPGEQAVFQLVLEVSDVTLSPYHNIAEIIKDSGDAFGGDSDSTPSDGSGASDTFDDSDVTNDSDADDEDDSDFADLKVEAEYDLALIKEQTAISATPATLGTQVTYEITVMNQGNVPTGAFAVEDTMPSGLSFVSATPAASADPGVGATGPVQWAVEAIDELAPGEQATFELVLEVTEVALSPYHNIAEIIKDSGSSYGGDSDSTPGDGSGASDTFDDSDVTNDSDVDDEDDSDFADLEVEAEYDLALIKEQTAISTTPANLGTQVTYEITVMNQGNVPSGAFALEDTMPAGLSYVSSSPAASSDPGVGATGPVQWAIAAVDELAPGELTTFELVLEVTDVTSSPYRNIAEIIKDSGSAFGDDSDSDPGNGSGASDTFDDPDVTNDSDVDDEDDSDFADLTVEAEYDLALIKEQTAISATPATLGTQATYEITVMNQGNVPSGSFTVDEAIPAGLTFVSASPSASVDPGVGNTGLVQWQVALVDELAPGAQATFEVVLEVADVTSSPYHNVAEITADSGAPYGGDDDSDPTDGSGASDTIDDSDVTNDNDVGDEDDSDFADLEVQAEYDLALIKEQVSLSTTPATLGTQVTYEITVMNQGNVPSGQFGVQDTIPAGLGFISASPAASADPGVGATGLVQWAVATVDELAPGEQTTFELILEVADVTSSPYHNIAEIIKDSGSSYGGDSDSKPGNGSGASDTFDDSDVTNDNDPGDEDDSDFADLKVAAEYDLALIKEQVSLSTTPATLGTQATYEITVMNQGNVPSGSFTVDEAIPAGLTFVSASPSASVDPGVGSTGLVQWQIALVDELAPGAQATFEILLEVADVTRSPYHNVAEITADSGAAYGGDDDSDPTDGSGATDTIDDSDVTNDNDVGDQDDSDFADLEVQAEYDLALIKEQVAISDASPTLGTQATYEIAVMNQGNVPSGSFTVDEVIPAGLTFVSASPSASVDPGVGSTGLVQWQVALVDELAPGAQTTFEVVLEVADVTRSPYHNVAEITADSGAAYGGDDDSDPTDGSGASDTIDDSDVTNDNDPGDQDDSDFADLEVQAEYDLALIKEQVSLSATPATLGTQVTYEITVMNQGNVPSGAFSVADELPSGLTFVSAAPAATSDPGAGSTGTVEWTVTPENELSPGAQATFQVTLEVADVTLSPYHNVADITTDSSAGYGGDSDSVAGDGSGAIDSFDDADVSNDNDPGDQDDSDFADLEVAAEYDLALVKEQTSVSATPATLGTQVTYQLSVMNQGNVPSGAFSISDAIPAGMSFVSATPAASTDPGVGNTGRVEWVVPSAAELAVAAQTTFEIVLEVTDVTLSPYRNSAEIFADSGAVYGGDSDSDPTDGSAQTDTFDDTDVTNDNDPGDEDDSDFASLEVASDYDLALIKEQVSLSDATATLGTTVGYEITVMNQGNVPSGSFTVTESIPAGLTFVSASPAATTDPGVGSTGSVTWNVPAANQLAPGAQVVLTIELQVADVTLSPYHNIAEITADDGDDSDSDPADGSGATDSFDDHDVSNDQDPGDQDDSDFADLEVTADYDLALIKQQSSLSATPPTLGTQVTYAITVMNQGNVPSGSFTVNDAIPAGLTFVSASPAATDPGVGGTGDVTWNVALADELAPGAQTQFTVVLEVADVTQSPYHNVAEITADSGAVYGGDGDSDPADGSAATDTFDDSDVTNDSDPGDQDDSDFADLEVEADYDLALIKQQTTLSTTPATLGTQATYEITVMNQGNVPSGTFNVTDAIPVGMTFVSATPAASSDPGIGATGAVEWQVGLANQLAPGAQTVFTLVLEVADVTESPYHNTAEISADGGAVYGGDDDSDPADGSAASDTFDDTDVTNDNDAGDEDDSDFADLEVEADYDLALIKQRTALSDNPATLGTQVTYAITVMNQGNVPSSSFSVDDVIPAGLGFVSASPAAATAPVVGDSGIVTWVVSSANQLAPGAQTVFTLVLEVTDVTLSPYRNIAEIASDSGRDYGGDDDSTPGDGSGADDTFDDTDVSNDNDPGDQDDSDFADLTVVADYDLALIKEQVAISATPPTLGTQVSYEITVMNQGNVPSGAISVRDVIPAGLSFVSASPAPTSDPGAGNTGTVTWSVASANSLAPSAQRVFTVVLEVSDVTLSPYHNVAEITSDSGDDADSDPADGSAFDDSFDDSDVTNDSDPGDQDDSDFADLEVESRYDLALIKEQTAESATPVTLGTEVTYEISVMNQGNVPSGSLTVVDAIPAGLSFVSALPAASSDPGVGGTGPVTWIIPTSNELAPGAQTVLQLVLKVSDVTQAPYHNTAEITADSGAVYGGDEDSDPTDGSASTDTFDDNDVTNDFDAGDQDDSDFADLEVEAIYDLALIKQQQSLSADPATLGTQVTYAITVMNQGNVPSGSITVDETIPPGMTFVSATPTASADPGAGNGGTVQWVLLPADELAPGEQTVLQVVLEVADVTLNPYHNVAEITADSGAAYGGDKDSDPADGSANTDTFDDEDVSNDQDPGDSDDSDFADLEVAAIYDLALIKQLGTVSPNPANLGSSVTFNITVMNQGNVPSGSFTVEDIIPAGMNFVSATPVASSDPGVGANGNVTWVIAKANELAPGAQATFTVELSIDDVTLSPYRNLAEITADDGAAYGGDKDSDPSDGSAASDTFDDEDVSNDSDPGDADDSDFAELDARKDYDLALVKTFVSASPSPANVGSQIVFDITVMNQGNVPSGTFTVTDMLPAAMAFVSATPIATSDPGVGNTGAISWTVASAASLAPGATTSFQVVAEIIGGPGTEVKNIADISADSSAPYGGDTDSVAGDGSGAVDVFEDTDVTNDQDPDDQDDSDFVSVAIPGNYDLALVKKMAPTQNLWVSKFDYVRYVIEVKNQGDIPSGKFSVVDTIPGGMVFYKAAGGHFTCANNSPSAGKVNCDYNPPHGNALPPGAIASIRLTLKVVDPDKAPFRNWAEITEDSGNDYDSNPGSNSGAGDFAPGVGSYGADPTQDHDQIDHFGIPHTHDEDDSDYTQVMAALTTPVTLQTFKAVDVDGAGTVDIRWRTSMEDGNAGFYLYGRENGGGWVRVHADMIPAKAQSDDGATYSQTVNAGVSTEFAITDVDLFGAETVHGPYKLDEGYGAEVPEAVLDSRIGGDEDEAAVVATQREVYIDTDKEGIYRVSFRQLRDAGYDFGRTSVNDLALTLMDEPVPMRVEGARDKDDPYSSYQFGPGGYIEFVAEAISSPYSRSNRYKLSVDSSKARRFDVDYTEAPETQTRARRVHIATETWAPNRAYARFSPIEDPWYADKITTIKQRVSRDYPIALERVREAQAGRIRVKVWSSYDDPEINKDHHVVVFVNGVRVGSRQFSGISSSTINAEIPANVLKSGRNIVKLELPMRGRKKLGQIFVESIEIDYAQTIVAESGAMTVSMTNAVAIDIPGLSSRDVSVYRKDDTGVYRSRVAIARNGERFTARVSGVAGNAVWHLADRSGRRSVKLRPVPATDQLLVGSAQYLAIAHPRFMTDALDRLLSQRMADGLSTKLVDVRQIYARYSGGRVDPEAIRDYLKDAAGSMDTKYVLLVGGDTYDPLNYLKLERGRALSYVPTLYAQTGQAVKHAPVDPLLGDIDKDGVPDLMLGRLAVQTKAQLAAMVDKILVYPYASHAGRAFTVSDGIDDSSSRSFKTIADQALSGLTGNWRSTHMSLEDTPKNRVSTALQRQLNRGVALTTWVGHSDRNVWSFDGVLTSKQVAELSNASDPTVVMQWGCWNNYYVDPKPVSMTYKWLVTPGSGAAASLGSTTLMEAGSEQIMATKMFAKLSAGMSLGEALYVSKREMVDELGIASVRDLLGGLVILGDPAIKVLME